MNTLFDKFEKKQYLCFEPLLFINATDPHDEEIQRLKQVLVNSAFEESSWGQPMPMAWVPLELQISNLRQDKVNIISMQEMSDLNKENGDLALTDNQIRVFLIVQHNIGKCLYFDHDGLRNFAIIQPAFLVNVLRSFVTDEMFWPKDSNREIFLNLNANGIIHEKDLFKLWSRMPPEEHQMDDKYKEYIVNMLVHLDILVEPKRYDKDISRKYTSFFVPCMVTSRNGGSVMDSCQEKGIVLSYALRQSVIPPTLAYRLIAAATSVWPLKNTGGSPYMYHKSAVLCVDDRNEIHIQSEGSKILVFLVNKESRSFINPDVAASVQECLTLALTKILDFYHRNFGSLEEHFNSSQYFEIEIGVACKNHEFKCSTKDDHLISVWR